MASSSRDESTRATKRTAGHDLRGSECRSCRECVSRTKVDRAKDGKSARRCAALILRMKLRCRRHPTQQDPHCASSSRPSHGMPASQPSGTMGISRPARGRGETSRQAPDGHLRPSRSDAFHSSGSRPASPHHCLCRSRRAMRTVAGPRAPAARWRGTSASHY